MTLYEPISFKNMYKIYFIIKKSGFKDYYNVLFNFYLF